MARTAKRVPPPAPVAIATTTSVATITKTLLVVAVAVGALATISAFGIAAAGSAKALIQASLRVAVIPNTPSVTVVQSPMRDVKLGDFAILRPNTTPVTVTQITFGLQTDLTTGELTNFRLVTTTNRAIAGPIASYDDYHDTVTFQFARPIAVSQLAKIRLIADIAPVNGQRSVRVGMVPSQHLKAWTNNGRPVPVGPNTAIVARRVTVNPAVVRGVFDINGTTEGYGMFQYDPQVVAGTDTPALGALEFNAQNENATIEKLALYIEDNRNAVDSLDSVWLWTPNLGKLTASQTFQLGDIDEDGDTDDVLVVFDQLRYAVPMNSTKTLLVGFTPRHIGTGPEATANSGEMISFQIAGEQTVVRGDSSGDVIQLNDSFNPAFTNQSSEYDSGFTSHAASLHGVRVNMVINDLPNGRLVNGEQIIGRFHFVIETGGNTDAQGNEAAFDLGNVKFELLANGIDLNGTTPAATDMQFFWASDPSTLVVLTNLGDDVPSVVVDLGGLASKTTPDTLVVQANQITGVDASGDYLQVKIPLTVLKWDDSIGATWHGLATGSAFVTGGALSY